MLRRILAVIALCGAIPAARAAPDPLHTDGPQTETPLINALVGRWTLVYMDSSTCSYGNLTIAPANPAGRADASFKVACAGVDSVYLFSVLNANKSNFVFYGVSTTGPNGVGPNRLQYDLVFDQLDCSLSGTWSVENPIGRLVLRKIDAC